MNNQYKKFNALWSEGGRNHSNLDTHKETRCAVTRTRVTKAVSIYGPQIPFFVLIPQKLVSKCDLGHNEGGNMG